MLVLGLDFETTGLDVSNDRIIEVGAVLWDTDTSQPIEMASYLINPGVPLSSEIVELTKITESQVQQHGMSPVQGIERLGKLISRASYVVAHNGDNFDRPMWEAEVRRHLGEDYLQACTRPWIDTRYDIPFPATMKTRDMASLEAAHGFTNPFAHRALPDVLAMLRVMSCYPFSEIERLVKSPLISIKAEVSYDDREKAKALGYYWDKSNTRWMKQIKEIYLDEEKSKADFPIIVIS